MARASHILPTFLLALTWGAQSVGAQEGAEAPAPTPAPVATPTPTPAPAPAPVAVADADATPAADATAAVDADATPAVEQLSELDRQLLEQGLSAGETIMVEGGDSVQPGAAHTIDAEALERYENDDIHRVLAAVPGVYMREEDGYGLRPNIGMRGSGTERSSKIALMEDGVLIAPAPYSAPAAYYFPMVTRMSRVEVVKGAIAVRHGPNTVGGAINLISAPIPVEQTARIDTALGANLYGKLHAGVGDSGKHWGYWVEGLRIQSDGFKELDGGGDTGFEKNDILAKARVNSDPDRPFYQELELKAGYSDELSNETYTGLSDADFGLTPNRRYAATQLDLMEARHMQLSLRHKVEMGADWSVNSTIYHHDFERAWGKLAGFTGDRGLDSILAAPNSGLNALYYEILTGNANSSSSAEHLILGTNDRNFASSGVQSVVKLARDTGPVEHDLSLGLRLHVDQANRFHYEDGYQMMDGVMVRDDSDRVVTQNNTGEARAWALFGQDSATWGRLTLTGGFRAEAISTSWTEPEDPSLNQDSFFTVFIPGAGAFYKLDEHLGVLAGVHKGFIPVSPGQDSSVKPETSVNTEAGLRYSKGLTRAELIGYYNDYSNLKATCSYSMGCDPQMVTQEFNGYGATAMGVESFASSELPLPHGDHAWLEQLSMPLRVSYTFNHSAFDTSFESDNPQWGDVEAGDELPYFAKHQLSAEMGLRSKRAEIAVAGRYVGAMRDIAGQGAIAEDERIDAYTVFDVATHLQLDRWGELYATLDNVFDTRYAVSRRPVGLRPGKPRVFVLGYKNFW